MTDTAKPSTMRQALVKDLKQDEGYSARLYHCTAGKPTIGYGRNLEDIGINREEAEGMLENDVKAVLCDLGRALPWYGYLPEPIARALANMCFNMGLPRLLTFKKMLSALKDGDYEQAAREALNSRWAKQVGMRAVRIAKLIEGRE